jgi:hypothetical protein
MSKITNAMLMEAINGINQKVDTLSKRVENLEGKSKPTVSKKGNAEKPTIKVSGYSTNIKDYEPKKVNGFYKWGKKTDTVKSRNYRAMMVAYCYAVSTKGKALSCYEGKTKLFEFDNIKEDYYKAQEKFKATYKYIKTSDR